MRANKPEVFHASDTDLFIKKWSAAAKMSTIFPAFSLENPQQEIDPSRLGPLNESLKRVIATNRISPYTYTCILVFACPPPATSYARTKTQLLGIQEVWKRTERQERSRDGGLSRHP